MKTKISGLATIYICTAVISAGACIITGRMAVLSYNNSFSRC